MSANVNDKRAWEGAFIKPIAKVMKERGIALFIPLRRCYFEAFEHGEKNVEFRPYGPRWNERTCRLGRRVTLSLGYGKNRRLHGWVTSFRTDDRHETIPGWKECYGDDKRLVACIGITIDWTNAEASQPTRDR